MLIEVKTLTVLGGISAIISGIIAAYTSFAGIYNASSLKEVVPLGEFAEVRQKAEQYEMERLRRLHPGDRIEKAGAHA